MKQGSLIGSVEGTILLAIIGLSLLLGGGLFFTNIFKSAPPPQALAICCDTGNGDQCVPQKGAGQTLTFKSPTSITFPQYKNVPVQYDLLKSGTHIFECFKHGLYSGQTVTYPDGKIHPIIMNNSQELSGTGNECPHRGFDQIADFRSGTKTCVEIPDDTLVYVCVQNCEAPFGNAKRDNSCDPTTPVYGNYSTLYDVYIRDPDYPNPGVPDVIKNCQLGLLTPTPTPNPSQPAGNETNSQLLFNPYAEHKSLQLHTFQFQQGGTAVDEPRPFCKPAVYLYTDKTEDVTVKINPQGKLTYSSPLYPSQGWQVTGNPDGKILFNNQSYDFLYYEASISDNIVPKINTGFSVQYSDLKDFFFQLLPKLGLNLTEQNQFADYWLKALPKSPFYTINVVPQNILNTLSPLSITPQPDTLLRVTLNFAPTDTKQNIAPPLITPPERKGFTAVEWAGMFKNDQNHKFTCLQ